MNELKKKITSRFDKDSFRILNAGRDIPVPDDDWNGIDEYIRDFLVDLNKSKHITTIYSCEGHTEDDHAYLLFNVSEMGWDILWNFVIPELSYRFCFVDPSVNENALYHLQWGLQVKNNEYNAGISISTTLSTFHSIGWETKKERFWNTIKEVFLKHFTPGDELKEFWEEAYHKCMEHAIDVATTYGLYPDIRKNSDPI